MGAGRMDARTGEKGEKRKHEPLFYQDKLQALKLFA